MTTATPTDPAGEQGTARFRRDEVLAFVIDRLSRGRGCPTFREIGDAVGISQTRARQLVDQLVAAKILERTTGLQRNLIVRDVTYARQIVVQAFRRTGGVAAAPLGELVGHCAQAQLPIVAVLKHIPEPE